MCGIAGLISSKNPVTTELLRAMTDPDSCSRGPDSSGEWIGAEGRIGFGHRRLAIIDLTEAGAQPMHSPCGRYTVTYNGEIYNFRELRAELEAAGQAPAWRGHSDTEVMLAAFTAWGLRKGIARLSGMFALAVWDHAEQTLTLARDRFGEKPLYYGWTAAGFAFASTLGPIAATPGFANPVDPQAVACLMARAYVPAPLSIHQRMFKLPPGCLLTVPLAVAACILVSGRIGGRALVRLCRSGPGRGRRADHRSGRGARSARGGADQGRWQPAGRRRAGRQFPFGRNRFLADHGDCPEMRRPPAQDLHHRLHRSRVSTRRCTPGRSRGARDRSHRTLRHRGGCTGGDPFAAGDVRRALRRFLADPNHLVSKLARRQVTVSLSGDGGDELFGGYNRHLQFPRLWRAMRKVPGPLRRAALGAAGALPPGLWNGLSDLARRRRSAWFGDNARRGLRLMARADDFDALFDSFMDDWAQAGSPVAGSHAVIPRLRLDPSLAHAARSADDARRRGDLPARRHPRQSRSRRNGGEP